MVQYVKDDTIASGLKLHSVTDDGLFALLYSSAVASEEIAKNKSAGFYDVFNEQDNRHKMEQKFLSNKTTIEISDTLTFKNIFGYNDVKSNDSIDIDGTSFPVIAISSADFGVGAEGYTFVTEQWSNETQLLGETMGGKLNYIAGFYYSEDTKETNNPICFPCDLAPAVPPTIFRYHFEVEDISTAVFVQGTYQLTDNLSATAGYRHTWEEVEIKYFSDDINNTLFPSGFGAVGDSADINKPSWTISLEYKPTADWLVYLANRGSFRSSGYNGTGSEPNPNLAGGVLANDYEEETTYDIELGVKFAGEVAGIPSRFNLAVYEQALDHAQRTTYPSVASVTGNVNEAEISGFEFDGIFDLTDWLQIGGAFAYTDAEFTDPSADVAGISFTFGPYADSPEWVRSFFFKAAKDMRDGGLIYLRGDYYGQSSFYYSNLGNTLSPDSRIDGYELYNIRVGWDNVMGSSFSLASHIKNLTDEEYQVGGIDFYPVIGTTQRLPGEPRTYGAELTYEF
jgi:iron complex outermembrane receptor protein